MNRKIGPLICILTSIMWLNVKFGSRSVAQNFVTLSQHRRLFHLCCCIVFQTSYLYNLPCNFFYHTLPLFFSIPTAIMREALCKCRPHAWGSVSCTFRCPVCASPFCVSEPGNHQSTDIEEHYLNPPTENDFVLISLRLYQHFVIVISVDIDTHQSVSALAKQC